jgi:cobalt/nickel transport system permease protein
MTSIDGSVIDFRSMDLLAERDTAIHRLDGRAKVLVTFAFIVSVVSFNKYELSALLPFFIFPVIMVSQGNIPAAYISKKVALVVPFALVIGMFNPLLDQITLVRLGSLDISGGWISCFSIIVRAILTVSASIILVCVTGFPAICQALEQLGAPRVFAVQLLFLYRYIFVLMDEGGRLSRARELRSFGGKGRGMGSYGSLIGNLLLRTWERAERIHMAMLARGFTGQFHTRHVSQFGKREFWFLLGWTLLFVILRLRNLSQILGERINGVFL